MSRLPGASPRCWPDCTQAEVVAPRGGVPARIWTRPECTEAEVVVRRGGGGRGPAAQRRMCPGVAVANASRRTSGPGRTARRQTRLSSARCRAGAGGAAPRRGGVGSGLAARRRRGPGGTDASAAAPDDPTGAGSVRS
jgi:hypothetical protein